MTAYLLLRFSSHDERTEFINGEDMGSHLVEIVAENEYVVKDAETVD